MSFRIRAFPNFILHARTLIFGLCWLATGGVDQLRGTPSAWSQKRTVLHSCAGACVRSVAHSAYELSGASDKSHYKSRVFWRGLPYASASVRLPCTSIDSAALRGWAGLARTISNSIAWRVGANYRIGDKSRVNARRGIVAFTSTSLNTPIGHACHAQSDSNVSVNLSCKKRQ